MNYTTKFKIGEKVTGTVEIGVMGLPATGTGPITDILISSFDGIKYRISDKWFREEQVEPVPDTVIIEILCQDAKAIACRSLGAERFDRLMEACRKALE